MVTGRYPLTCLPTQTDGWPHTLSDCWLCVCSHTTLRTLYLPTFLHFYPPGQTCGTYTGFLGRSSPVWRGFLHLALLGSGCGWTLWTTRHIASALRSPPSPHARRLVIFAAGRGWHTTRLWTLHTHSAALPVQLHATTTFIPQHPPPHLTHFTVCCTLLITTRTCERHRLHAVGSTHARYHHTTTTRTTWRAVLWTCRFQHVVLRTLPPDLTGGRFRPQRYTHLLTAVYMYYDLLLPVGVGLPSRLTGWFHNRLPFWILSSTPPDSVPSPYLFTTSTPERLNYRWDIHIVVGSDLLLPQYRTYPANTLYTNTLRTLDGSTLTCYQVIARLKLNEPWEGQRTGEGWLLPTLLVVYGRAFTGYTFGYIHFTNTTINLPFYTLPATKHVPATTPTAAHLPPHTCTTALP